MRLVTQNTHASFLASSEYIDWQHPIIRERAKVLKENNLDTTEIANACFKYVRDEIQHSVDFQRNGISCKASQVLANAHGFCYAKAHLLTALLRANDIPTGLCYQRLQMGHNNFGLHGLIAVYLSVEDKSRWFRLDPRGNKINVNAQFSLQNEQLAYQVKHDGEIDFNEIHSEPLPCVVDVLNRYANYHDILHWLPDFNG